MFHYRQSIAIFAIVVPAILTAAVIGAGISIKSKMSASFETKLASYKEYETGRLSALELETQVNKQRPLSEQWEAMLKQETASTVTSNLRQITEHLPPKEIQQTAFEPLEKGGFGSASAQKSSQIRIALRGTFRTMQRAFHELETRMPQLQLQDLKIDTAANQASLLNFQVTYTAWEK
jgi:hypothetical protein